MDPIVVIGFGMGAIGAVRTILGNSREGDIVVIEKRDFDTYSPCGMPYVVGGEVGDHGHLKHDFPQNKRLTIHRGSEALSLDKENKTVAYRTPDGAEETIQYSQLLLDVGSSPIVPPIPFNKDLVGNGVYTFTRPSDVDLLLSRLDTMENVAVVGAGAIGLEMVHALHARGKKVTLVEMAEQPLPNSLDKDMAKLALAALPEDVDKRFSTPLEEIGGETKVEYAVVGGEKITVDTVVLCLGVKPNTGMADAAGLETSRLGIVVDQGMHTSDESIFAVGDCIQSKCSITESPMGSRIAGPALHQGIVAGKNIIGSKASYPGSRGAFVTVVGETRFASVGLKAANVEDSVSARVKVKTRPEFMGSKEVTVKLVAEPSGRIVGCQAAGPGAEALVNRISLGIDLGATAENLTTSETAYCPPVNDVFDPITTAAETLVKKIERKRGR